jgi:hypothetical protein
LTTCAFLLPSKLTLSSTGKDNKSNGVQGLHPYIISKGENFVVKCTLLLYAYSMNDKNLPNF